MTGTLLDRLAERLRSAPAAITAATPVAVAVSGGIDSMVLLSAVHEIGTYSRLRCIHIDHQLQADSAQWAEFCSDRAAQLEVEFVSRVVECDTGGNSIEAAARTARYAALAGELIDGEVLLTAHHADDQLETLLYRLVRGTGITGLRGIRAFEPLGCGYVMRPLLTETRAEIRALAQTMAVQWREDPSNAEQRFDRNYLRHSVLPGVIDRWPRAGQAAARLVASADDAAELAAELALADLGGTDTDEWQRPDCLPLERLAGLSAARQRNVLRFAVQRADLPVPDAAALERIRALLGPAGSPATVEWPGAEAHRHAPGLYLRRARRPVPDAERALVPEQPCDVADGRISLERSPAPALPDAWVRGGLTVRFRVGGERFQPAGSARPQLLREWMRSNNLLPWMRDRVPLIFHGQELVAVADLGISESAATAGNAAGGWRVAWQDRPRTS